MAFDLCLVSGNDISREGLTHILESEGFNVVKSAENVRNLELEYEDTDALVVIDCPMLSGQSERVARARDMHADARVVVLSDEYDPRTIVDCFNAGAQGYIIKKVKSNRMVAALRLAALGEKVVPSDFVDVIGGRGLESESSLNAEREIEDAKLSPREVDVLCCLMAGFPNKVIARQLDVCEATVKVHVKAILRKLNVRNRTQAALWANSHGIREPALAS